jgi:endonuclease/exonuclease/phosphatase family metal-dependent hydrolase
MRRPRRSWWGLVVAGCAALMTLPLTAAPAAASTSRPTAVTVMTRNVYLGGDITGPVRAALGSTGPAALLALGQANHRLRATVDRTDFSVRSRLLAREIARAAPDVVGLQEVALWRRGPMQLDQLGVPNATEVDYDFLQILLDDLDDRRARYRVVAVQTESDVEAPAFVGNPFDRTATETRDVRLTVRDVILVRQRSALRVTGTGGGQYTARLDLDLGGLPLSIVRGYTWADLRAGSRSFRFVNTHLESQNADLALAQARELLAGPALRARRTVLVCDCNSDPLNDTVRPGSTVPYSAAYRLLTGAGGFTDQWLRQRRPQPEAVTAALSEQVDDPTAAALDRRLDLVLTRFAPWTREPVATRGQITGDEVADRDRATGLWPSDHAGVVLRLRFR